jgi:hypothetical protein
MALFYVRKKWPVTMQIHKNEELWIEKKLLRGKYDCKWRYGIKNEFDKIMNYSSNNQMCK